MMVDTDCPEISTTGTEADTSTHTSDRKSARPQRIEVITRGERRRRWSLGEKQAIVAESLAPNASLTAVARRHVRASRTHWPPAWRAPSPPRRRPSRSRFRPWSGRPTRWRDGDERIHFHTPEASRTSRRANTMAALILLASARKHCIGGGGGTWRGLAPGGRPHTVSAIRLRAAVCGSSGQSWPRGYCIPATTRVTTGSKQSSAVVVGPADRSQARSSARSRSFGT